MLQLRRGGGSDGKESACNVGDPGSTPGLGRSPGEGNGNPLLYSWLENSTDREAWQATVHGVTKSRTRLSDFTLLVVGTQICSFNTTKGCLQVQEGREELFHVQGQEWRW